MAIYQCTEMHDHIHQLLHNTCVNAIRCRSILRYFFLQLLFLYIHEHIPRQLFAFIKNSQQSLKYQLEFILQRLYKPLSYINNDKYFSSQAMLLICLIKPHLSLILLVLLLEVYTNLLDAADHLSEPTQVSVPT